MLSALRNGYRRWKQMMTMVANKVADLIIMSEISLSLSHTHTYTQTLSLNSPVIVP